MCLIKSKTKVEITIEHLKIEIKSGRERGASVTVHHKI
jgi:hypothetical protein